MNIETTIKKLEENIVYSEKNLSEEMLALSQRLKTKAFYVEVGGHVNGIGEIQAQGNIIDASCGELASMRNTLKLLKGE